MPHFNNCTLRLFICLVIDTLYRNCDFPGVVRLWEVTVAADPHRNALFGQGCQTDEVLVTNSSRLTQQTLNHIGKRKGLHLAGSKQFI